MGVAIDTVVGAATNPGAGGAAAVPNAGDSFTVRSFAAGSKAALDFVTRQGATEGFVQIKSPRMHDAVRGFQLITSESPAVMLLPQQVDQPVYPSDTLTVQVSGGAAEVDAVAFGIYYGDLGGVSARLHMPQDLYGSIVNVKPLEVDVAANAVSAAWTDTLLTATENVLKADTYYAVLGYTVDTAVLAVGIKGPETGNLRVCGPGPTLSLATDDYFIRQSVNNQRPYVPVFNANNRNNLFVSTAVVAVAATPKVVLLLAELAAGFAA